MEGWTPLTKLARQAEVPEASARRYASTFSHYFRSRTVGRVRLYDAACVPVLQLIAETYGQGARTAAVEEALSARFGQVHEVVTTATSMPPAELIPILQAFTATAERLATAVERQNELLEQLTRAGMALPGESPSNSRQEAQEGTEEGEFEELEGATKEKAENGHSRPSWWKRLFGRKS